MPELLNQVRDRVTSLASRMTIAGLTECGYLLQAYDLSATAAGRLSQMKSMDIARYMHFVATDSDYDSLKRALAERLSSMSASELIVVYRGMQEETRDIADSDTCIFSKCLERIRRHKFRPRLRRLAKTEDFDRLVGGSNVEESDLELSNMHADPLVYQRKHIQVERDDVLVRIVVRLMEAKVDDFTETDFYDTLCHMPYLPVLPDVILDKCVALALKNLSMEDGADDFTPLPNGSSVRPTCPFWLLVLRCVCLSENFDHAHAIVADCRDRHSRLKICEQMQLFLLVEELYRKSEEESVGKQMLISVLESVLDAIQKSFETENLVLLAEFASAMSRYQQQRRVLGDMTESNWDATCGYQRLRDTLINSIAVKRYDMGQTFELEVVVPLLQGLEDLS